MMARNYDEAAMRRDDANRELRIRQRRLKAMARQAEVRAVSDIGVSGADSTEVRLKHAMHTTPDLSTDEAFFAVSPKAKARNFSRGNLKHGLTGSHTHRQWQYIKRQCEGKSVRGFCPVRTICVVWTRPSVIDGLKVTGFERFIADMGEAPSPEHRLRLEWPLRHYSPGHVFWRKVTDAGEMGHGYTDTARWSDNDMLRFAMRRVATPHTPREESVYASTEQGSEEAMPAARAYDQTAASSLGLGVPKFKEEDTLPDDVPVLSVAEAAAMGLFKPLTKAEVKALETAAAKCKTTAQRRAESFDEIVSPIPDEDFNDDA